MPFARTLITGTKSVEIRRYPLKKIGCECFVDYCVTETTGCSSEAKEIGTVRFESEFEYTSMDAFRNDEHRHRIPEGPPYDWQPASTPKLFGWVTG